MDVRAAVGALPREPGVYRFRDARGRAMYAGRAVDLRRRVGSYWRDLGDRPHLARMVRAVARIEAVVCDSEHEAAWLERNVLEHRMPPANRVPGGLETPVHIRLDSSAATPGLKVVHLPTPRRDTAWFGPYLGGQRARTTVAALHRAFPLHYTGAALTVAEREMARARGVGPERRDELVGAVRAVLDRDPAAVAALRAELVRRRQAASDEAAYELAGRIQGELEALEWTVAPQRVTVATAYDLDVSGWHEGTLVSFTIRGGRMRDWRQRACSARAAQQHLDATPPPWREFAGRNAVLAATLAAHAGRPARGS
ncbi:GIY-YIG nuclease family protein [Catellatospora sp. NPDC049609]|uniref:GIY-YIG nuclease family protein n=1 Tax=Catellatospora sp. NPDC049609 TaxID=3155505 RepID=UPI003412CFCC